MALPIDMASIKPVEGDLLDVVEALLDERGDLACQSYAVYSPSEYYLLVNFCQVYQNLLSGWEPL